MQETWVWSLGREEPLEKGMATHSSILAWRIKWTQEPGGVTKGRAWLSDWHFCMQNNFVSTGLLLLLSRFSRVWLCDPIDVSPPGSTVPGILQARTLEWVAISFSSAWKWKVKVKSLSRVWLFTTPWTAAYQAPPSMVFSRQEYWSGVPLPSPFYRYK